MGCLIKGYIVKYCQPVSKDQLQDVLLTDCYRLDDWLRAGVNYADNVVVVNKETSNSEEDGYLSDCNTIVAVQTIFRYV